MSAKSILVIGGGIAGIQASLDLAEVGMKVYLVEKSPSIGGHMAQLDKTFPTNDCAVCILGPKIIEVGRHKNITILTCSEISQVLKKENGFSVKILKKPRYVDESKCTACGACAQACLLRGKILDRHNCGLAKRGAIYLPYAQAYPFKNVIDAEKCLFLTRGVCGREPACKTACKTGAIDFSQKPIEIVKDFDAIVVAIGFDLFDSSSISEYGYGKYKNVVTSLEFERIICASGPTGGIMKRPSDSTEPKRIAFIQCVGSRDSARNPYCCSICCLFSTKEAILVREQEPRAETYIFYTDLRTSGKDAQKYIDKAKKDGVIYIRSRPGEIVEDTETDNLRIMYSADGKTRSLEVDLVILACALTPAEDSEGLSHVLQIELDKYGFFKPKDGFFHPLDTDVPRIFICGFCRAPSNIADSVLQASAVASRVIESVGA